MSSNSGPAMAGQYSVTRAPSSTISIAAAPSSGPNSVPMPPNWFRYERFLRNHLRAGYIWRSKMPYTLIHYAEVRIMPHGTTNVR